MRKTTPTKKAADWHSADIVAALTKKGWSLRRLSLHHNYKDGTTLKHAIGRHWPKGEKLIAAAIGVPAETIWPSRYKGNTQGAKRRPVTRAKGKA